MSSSSTSSSSSSDPPAVMPDLSVNLSFYGFASLVYLYMIYVNPDNNLLIKVMFLLLVLGINILLMWWLMSQQCVNPNTVWVFGGPVLTWIFLFVPVFWLLENMYVWLQPFGNTFGYLVMKLMGVTSFMDKILKDKVPEDNNRINKYINYIRSDPWGFFSMLTTNEDATPSVLRADKAFDELSDKLKPGENTQANKTEFINFVRIKELVAKFIFYLLTLNLMTDITAIFIMEKSPCELSEQEQEVQDQKAKNSANADPDNNVPQTVYSTRE